MSKKKETSQELISHHVFLLPFKWEKEDGAAYEINQFHDLIHNHLDLEKATEWKRSDFNLERVVDYNEFNYFFDYVAEVLYQTDTHNKEEQNFIGHFTYNLPPGKGIYKFEAPGPDGKSKEYTLEIDSILLHLYYSGVGVLSFHLNNRKPSQGEPEDIIRINQFGRRVYPPFYFIDQDKVGHQAQFDETQFVGKSPAGAEIANWIEIDFNDGTNPRRENWNQDLAQRLKEGEIFKFNLPAFLEPFLFRIEDGYDIYPVLDDRMFVLSWYGNDGLARRIARGEPGREEYRLDDWWYRYIFVDAKYRSVQDPADQEATTIPATYARWRNYSTLYGVTEYSMVLLTKSLPTLRSGYSAYLVTHLQTIYYRLAELVLVQRASIQRFSDDITHISKLDGADPAQAEKASLLNRRYIRFVNQIYFREVTPQQQGIELYDLLQQQARISNQVTALQDEIERLQNYVRQETDRQLLAAEKKRMQREEESEKRRSDILAVLGAIFLAPGLLIAVHDLGYMGTCLEQNPKYLFGLTLLAAVISVRLCWWAYPGEIVESSTLTSSTNTDVQPRAWSRPVRGIPIWRLVVVALAYLILLSIPLIYALLACPAG
ncbi:hypothetical protein [Neolewinella agarilytica]|uniref:CorA-like Mg2+ transporter protein n=1 Tax=Neolewinella agarilytica TaxID=478744 RepID=A0A1H9HBZ7_9BACT|nr:hypothetical protein [Neolewinella agarilytica]SEQ59758.1 hypothetical protein SAMN05444359_11296 [Neolewinella agarilytica]